MKSLSSKRVNRLEKKKKKMAAFLEISKLNEYDRMTKSANTNQFNSKFEFAPIEAEPSPKRSRTDCQFSQYQPQQTQNNSNQRTGRRTKFQHEYPEQQQEINHLEQTEVPTESSEYSEGEQCQFEHNETQQFQQKYPQPEYETNNCDQSELSPDFPQHQTQPNKTANLNHRARRNLQRQIKFKLQHDNNLGETESSTEFSEYNEEAYYQPQQNKPNNFGAKKKGKRQPDYHPEQNERSNFGEREKSVQVSKYKEESQHPQVNQTEKNNLGPSGKPKLEGEEYLKLKKQLREITNKMRAIPRFHLRDMGENASLKKDLENRVPLFMSDIQHFILYSLIGHHSPYSPARWCALEKFNKLLCTTVLVIEDISMFHFISYSSYFPFLSTFEHHLEVVTPGAYKADVVQDLASIPLTRTMVKKFRGEHGTLEKAVKESDEVFDRIKHLFPLKEIPHINEKIKLPEGDRFPRTQLLLSGWQMVEENFPLPIQGLMETKYKGYVLTKDRYEDVTPKSPMFSIDCEMCVTSIGQPELTRVSVVDENHEVVYEQLVKPDNKIVDYLTRFSGITPKMMRNVTKTLKSVQEDLRAILPPNAILVGQSLNGDMHALKMMHPYIIDTSVIYNVTGDRQRKTKLKTLSQEFLNEAIQEGTDGHCSIEDSIACMKLVKHKLNHNLYYGDAVMGGVTCHFRHQPELGNVNYVTSMFKQVTKFDKSCRIVAKEDTIDKYQHCTFKEKESSENFKRISCISLKSNDDIVDSLCKDTDKYSLNIAHVSVKEMKVKKDENLDRLKEVDGWIEKIYKHMLAPGLCIVIFGGQKETANGCCFLQLKKQQL